MASHSVDRDSYFSQETPPPSLDSTLHSVQTFIQLNTSCGRLIVLVTSGGTSVPLEKNTVRFIDNFSQGSRGAASAEYFIQQGYAVLFLSRTRSKQPYMRHFTLNDVVTGLANNVDVNNSEHNTSNSVSCNSLSDRQIKALCEFKKATSEQMLMTIEYKTLSDYLFLLRGISHLLSPYKKMVMLYLAAAVSDFYIPTNEMSTHKIPSHGKSKLQLELYSVPKMLHPLTTSWAPYAFTVTFKLETDPSVLMSKARLALESTGPCHRVVIANLLSEIRTRVQLVSSKPENDREITLSPGDIGFKDIEDGIIQELVLMHRQYMSLTQ